MCGLGFPKSESGNQKAENYHPTFKQRIRQNHVTSRNEVWVGLRYELLKYSLYELTLRESSQALLSAAGFYK